MEHIQHSRIARQHAQGVHDPLSEEAARKDKQYLAGAQARQQRDHDIIVQMKKDLQTKKETQAQSEAGPDINDPNDKHEKEADEVAAKVTGGSGAASLSSAGSGIQCKEESSLMAKSDPDSYRDGKLKGTGELQATLDSSKGSGEAMDDETKNEMEGKMNADLSDVRIHTGAKAHDMSEGINAKAFTHGQDIYFKNGNYDPGSKKGKSLLAHELAHTQQQKGGLARRVQRQDDKNGKKLAKGTSAMVRAGKLTGNEVQKIELDETQTAQLIATVMAESNQGEPAYKEIAWVYVNLIAKEGFDTGMKRSSAFKGKNVWYKAYMVALGEGNEFKDDPAKGSGMMVKDKGHDRVAKNMGEYVEKNEYFNFTIRPRLTEMKTYIEGNVLPAQQRNPIKGWTGQGYWMDLNNYKNKGDHWHKVRQYYILKLDEKIAGPYIKKLGSGNGTTFLFDREKIINYFNENPGKLPAKLSDIPDLYYDQKMDKHLSDEYRKANNTYPEDK